jgi:hypothetical protein
MFPPAYATRPTRASPAHRRHTAGRSVKPREGKRELACGRLSDKHVPALDRPLEDDSRTALRGQRPSPVGPDGQVSLFQNYVPVFSLKCFMVGLLGQLGQLPETLNNVFGNKALLSQLLESLRLAVGKAVLSPMRL